MSFENLSFESLDLQLQKFVDECPQLLEKIKELRDLVLVNPTKNNKYDLTGLTWNSNFELNEKILLGILHWYFPEELRFTFNLELDRIWGNDYIEYKVILISKKVALGFLLVQDRWNEFDFFGNILKAKTLRKFWSLRFKISDSQKTGKFRKLNFCDYKDKGSKPPDHQREPVYNYRKLLTVEDLELRRLASEEKRKLLLIQIEDKLRLENVV